MRKLIILSVAVLLCQTAVFPGNWPNWRGPGMNGVTEEKNLPVKWSVSENVTWKLAMPDFTGSTPIIWNQRVFLNVAEGNDLFLWCVDRENGMPLWKKLLGSGNLKIRKQNMSSPSPVTDGKNVWALTGTGILKSFDFNGKERWMRDIQKDYGPFGLNWGYASSPLLHKVRVGANITNPSKNRRDGTKLSVTSRRSPQIFQQPIEILLVVR